MFKISDKLYTSACPSSIDSINNYLQSDPRSFYIILLEGCEIEQKFGKITIESRNFIKFPIPDFGVPDVSKVMTLFKELQQINPGKIVFQCMGGIGRSSLMAAAYLCFSGKNLQRSLSEISNARGLAVPETIEQNQWLISFEKQLEKYK
jgi:hypothetical protein